MPLTHQPIAGRSVAALAVLLALVFAAAVPAAAGDLDPSFDGDGKVVTDISGGEDRAFAVAVQRDGKIVVAGQAADGSSSNFALARYNPDGSPDAGFGTGGKVRTSSAGGVPLYVIGAVAIQSDGKIVAAGSSGGPRRFVDFGIARYNPDGSLDASFGTGGATATDFVTSAEHATAVAIQPDGRIVVAGEIVVRPFEPLRRQFALARYDARGTLDPTFDGDGKVVTEFAPGSDDGAWDVALQPDGKIVVAGGATGSGGRDFALARYNLDGSPDPSFDGDGRVVTGVDGAWAEMATAVALQPDGKIVAAGDSRNYVFALARYNADGSLDRSFGGNGVLTTGWETAAPGHDVLVLPDRKIVAVGGGFDFALARYDRNGRLDPTFGSGGKVATDLGSSDTAWSAALQSDGRIVVAGESGRDATDNFAVARYVGATPTCRVPNVRGRTLAAARAALRTARCTLGRVQRRRSATVRRGLVISQSPKARTTLAEGARVSVVVSLGRRR